MTWFFAIVLLGISSAQAGGAELRNEFEAYPEIQAEIDKVEKNHCHGDDVSILLNVYKNREKDINALKKKLEDKKEKNKEEKAQIENDKASQDAKLKALTMKFENDFDLLKDFVFLMKPLSEESVKLQEERKKLQDRDAKIKVLQELMMRI